MTLRVGRSARRIIGGLSALAMLAAVSGCGLLGGSSEDGSASEGGTSTAPGQVEKSKIKLGLLNILDVASVHIAIKKGYFKEEGLEIEPVIIQGGAAAIPGLISGSIDITFGNWVSYFAAESQGAAKDKGGLKLISDGYQAKSDMFVIVAAPDSGIKSPKDLDGKTIAINTYKNIAELTAKATLEANDVDPSKVKFKELGFPDMEAAVKNKSVDAAFMVEPFIARSHRGSGFTTVLDAASGPTKDIPIGGYATTGDFASKNPNSVAAFQRAMAKGQKEAQDRSVVEPVLQDYAKIDKDTATLVHFGEYPTSLESSRLQRVADLMLTYQLLKEKFDVTPMIVSGSAG